MRRQGRYFLPLLPGLAVALPSLGRWALALRPVTLAAATPAVTLWAVPGRYYVAP